MSKLRRQKRLLAWLSAIVVLCNVLVGALGHAQAKAVVVDDVLGPLIICTADGAHGSGLDGGSTPGPRPPDHCQACLTQAQVPPGVAVLLVAIVYVTPVAKQPVPARLHARAPRLQMSGVGSRAPPLSA